MLVVSRKVGQRILVGTDIEIVVTEISRKSVRLGIKAPRDLPVVRGEVVENVEAANRAAAASSLDVLQQLGTSTPTAASPVRATNLTARGPSPEPESGGDVRQPHGDPDRQGGDDET